MSQLSQVLGARALTAVVDNIYPWRMDLLALAGFAVRPSPNRPSSRTAHVRLANLLRPLVPECGTLSARGERFTYLSDRTPNWVGIAAWRSAVKFEAPRLDDPAIELLSHAFSAHAIAAMFGHEGDIEYAKIIAFVVLHPASLATLPDEVTKTLEAEFGTKLGAKLTHRVLDPTRVSDHFQLSRCVIYVA